MARERRRADAAGQALVVVLDQDAVVEAQAMIGAAAAADGVLLERAESRRRLARVEDGDAAARPHRRTRAVSVAMPHRRWRKLSAVRSASSSACASPLHAGDDFAGLHARAIAPSHFERRPRIELPKASAATSMPATTRSPFARIVPRARMPRATVAALVTSPRPRSSASAWRTRSRYASGGKRLDANGITTPRRASA